MLDFHCPNNPAISFSNLWFTTKLAVDGVHGVMGIRETYILTTQSGNHYLPVGTRAYYLYIEGNSFTSANITATANDGTTSGAIPVNGFAGANYYGFIPPTAACMLTTITITADPTALGFCHRRIWIKRMSIITCPASQTIALGPGSCDTSFVLRLQ
ncbi:MAG: hypothetical protein IPI30_22270 [Saprospiraceae bacterium]|nr:hypothetical protein [Candidatus Vicinibacter affinis]